MSRHRVDSLPDAGGLVRLPPGERRHIERVLRLGSGDDLVIFDGRGLEARAVIEAHPDGGWAARLIEEPRSVESALPACTVLLAAIKGDRLASTVEKLTELGAAGIVVFRADRSVRVAAEGLARRLTAHVESALKQCGRPRTPALMVCEDLESALHHVDPEASNWVLDPAAETGLVEGLTASEAFSATLVVGPEGGLTDRELEMLATAGWRKARIAGWLLRSDTAAVAAAAVALSTLAEKKS